MMKKTIYLTVLSLIGLSLSLEAQEDLQIKTSSGDVLMEVREDGVLLPQLTTTERTTTAATLGAADNGLMVYDTDTESFWIWKNPAWAELGGSSEMELPANPDPGTIAYYDGSNWLPVAPGTYGAFLSFCDGVPSWGGCLPKVVTNTEVETFGLTFRIFGEVLTNGGAPLTSRGFVWSTSPNPSLADFSSVQNYSGNSLVAGVGLSVAVIESDDFSTTYYYRAFAENDKGIVYGNEVSFTTASEDPLEVVLPNNDIIEVYPLNITEGAEFPWGDYNQDITGVTNYATFNDAITDYNGESNTMAIVSQLGNFNNGNYSAKLCADFVSGDGKDDWYLPSAGELQAMADQLGDAMYIEPNSPTSSYASSSESSAFFGQAWFYDINSSYWSSYNKTTRLKCRCVRRD